MSNVIKLNLPAPSSELINTIQNYADSFVFDPDKKRWVDEFHDNTVNSVLHYFDSPDFLNQLIREEFQKFFPQHKIGSVIGIMKNAEDTPACLTPHCDRGRAMAITYFITLGGNNVSTVFYNRVETIGTVSTNLRYNEVSPVEDYVAEQDQWYCYSVNRCHSVENITSTRLFIAIRLVRSGLGTEVDFEYTMSDFRLDYPELVQK